MTIYEYDLSELGQSTFQSIQSQAMNQEKVNDLQAAIQDLQNKLPATPEPAASAIRISIQQLQGQLAQLMGGAPPAPVPSPATHKPGLVDWFKNLGTVSKLLIGAVTGGLVIGGVVWAVKARS